MRNRACDACVDGYWNLSGRDSSDEAGCEPCHCDPLGSYNMSCGVESGQCHCRPGVTGRRCDTCAPLHYGFGGLLLLAGSADDGAAATGCRACECHPLGTEPGSRLQCDERGMCACREHYDGAKCDRCKPNRYNFTRGCLPCDDCYSLVHDKVNAIRTAVATIERSLLFDDDDHNHHHHHQQPNEPKRHHHPQHQHQQQSLLATLNKVRENVADMQQLLAAAFTASTFETLLEQAANELRLVQSSIGTLNTAFARHDHQVAHTHALSRQFNESVWQSAAQLAFIQSKRDARVKQIAELQDRLSTGSSEESNDALKIWAKKARTAAQNQMLAANRFAAMLNASVSGARIMLANVSRLLDDYKALSSASSRTHSTTTGAEEHLRLRNQAIGIMNEALVQRDKIATLVTRLQELNTTGRASGEQEQSEAARAHKLAQQVQLFVIDFSAKVFYSSPSLKKGIFRCFSNEI